MLKRNHEGTGLWKNAVKSLQILGLTRRVFAYLAWDPGFTPQHHQKKGASNMKKMKIMKCDSPSSTDDLWWEIEELGRVPQGENVIQSTIRMGGCWWEIKELDMSIFSCKHKELYLPRESCLILLRSSQAQVTVEGALPLPECEQEQNGNIG